MRPSIDLLYNKVRNKINVERSYELRSYELETRSTNMKLHVHIYEVDLITDDDKLVQEFDLEEIDEYEDHIQFGFRPENLPKNAWIEIRIPKNKTETDTE